MDTLLDTNVTWSYGEWRGVKTTSGSRPITRRNTRQNHQNRQLLLSSTGAVLLAETTLHSRSALRLSTGTVPTTAVSGSLKNLYRRKRRSHAANTHKANASTFCFSRPDGKEKSRKSKRKRRGSEKRKEKKDKKETEDATPAGGRARARVCLQLSPTLRTAAAGRRGSRTEWRTSSAARRPACWGNASSVRTRMVVPVAVAR